MNASNPLLSIIVVTKNDQENLFATLESIPSTLDCEILIQDAESSYNILEQLSGHILYSKVRLEIKRDSGIYDGMNKAINRARGDFICFLNCGDLFTEFAEAGLSSILVRLGDNFDVVKFLAETPDNGIQIERASPFYFFRRMLNHQSLVYRKSAFSKWRFDASHRIISDMRHFLESGLMSRTAYVDVVLIKYLGGGIATSKKMINQNWSERASVFSWHIPTFQKVIIISGVLARSVARFFGLYQ